MVLEYKDTHYADVIMTTIASQITSLTIVYSTIYSGADQSKHQSSASLAFVWGIHRGPVNSPHKWPVTRKMFPFDDVIMGIRLLLSCFMLNLIKNPLYCFAQWLVKMYINTGIFVGAVTYVIWFCQNKSHKMDLVSLLYILHWHTGAHILLQLEDGINLARIKYFLH